MRFPFKIPAFITNKYFIATAAVLVWILFFDTNNLIFQFRLHRQYRNLQKEKQYLSQEIARDSISILNLKTDPDYLERFARERYFMKRENEVIYIVPEKPN